MIRNSIKDMYVVYNMPDSISVQSQLQATVCVEQSVTVLTSGIAWRRCVHLTTTILICHGACQVSTTIRSSSSTREIGVCHEGVRESKSG